MRGHCVLEIEAVDSRIQTSKLLQSRRLLLFLGSVDSVTRGHSLFRCTLRSAPFSLLMSSWSVAEQSSVELVKHFFKYLKSGKGRLEALRLARADVRHNGYDHPFFWAPFILIGEPE